MTSILTVTPNPGIDHTIFISDFTAGKVNRVKGERHDVGGKGFNVASFLKDYGIDDIAASGFLGRENKDLFEGFFIEREFFHGINFTDFRGVFEGRLRGGEFKAFACELQCPDFQMELEEL